MENSKRRATPNAIVFPGFHIEGRKLRRRHRHSHPLKSGGFPHSDSGVTSVTEGCVVEATAFYKSASGPPIMGALCGFSGYKNRHKSRRRVFVELGKLDFHKSNKLLIRILYFRKERERTRELVRVRALPLFLGFFFIFYFRLM